MDMSTLNTVTSSTPTLTGASSGSSGSATNAVSADTFLKLLVTQMENQDPLNPMDNSQMTSQLAQINTVQGIGTLNTTVQGLNTQLVQMQALQGASLVGRPVLLQGNALSIANGQGQGSFDLASAADSVQVDVLSPAGNVVDSISLGAQGAGRHDFTWPAAGVDPNSGLTFRVTAKSGATQLTATPLMRDTVDSVSIDGDQLTLQLDRSGDVPYSDIKAFD
jgi:flagellar basal-body rod modification protein FlgD